MGMNEVAYQEHKAKAPKSVNCMVVTCSDTRTKETDKTGQLVIDLLKKNSHKVLAYHVVKDEAKDIQKVIESAAKDRRFQAVILNGGTGLTRRDTTVEVLEKLLEKRLDGFGELFRALGYQEIGSPAMLSRATAGVYQGKAIFSLPGSEEAARLAMERLILPELGHIIFLVGQQ
jgi:molybdenum cofactor biosynthesis protein B